MNIAVKRYTLFNAASNGMTRAKRFVANRLGAPLFVLGMGAAITAVGGYFVGPLVALCSGITSISAFTGACVAEFHLGRDVSFSSTFVLGFTGFILGVCAAAGVVGYVDSLEKLSQRVNDRAVHQVLHDNKDVARVSDKSVDWVASFGKAISATATASLACPRRPDLVVIDLGNNQELKVYTKRIVDGHTTWVKQAGGLTGGQLQQCRPL